MSDFFPEIEAYLRALHVLRQLSPHTLKAYRTDLLVLQENARAEGLTLGKVSNALIRRWAASLHAKEDHLERLRAHYLRGVVFMLGSLWKAKPRNLIPA